MKWVILGLLVHLVAAAGIGNPAVSKTTTDAPGLWLRLIITLENLV